MSDADRRTREKQILIRVTQEERDLLDAAAKLEHRSRESFCRLALLEVAQAVLEDAPKGKRAVVNRGVGED